MIDEAGLTKPGGAERVQTSETPITPDWLIILTMPNTGSTALAQLLLSAPDTVALNPLAEGYRMVPEMDAPPARWQADLPINYGRMRELWLKAARDNARPEISRTPLVIEKSPANLVRYEAILQMLAGMKTNLAMLTRDPYPTCASWNKRYDHAQVATVWGREASADMEEFTYFQTLADLWVERAQILRGAREQGAHWIRYEDFTARPDRMAAELSDAIGRAVIADPEAKLRVKDYKRQQIVNMNDKQSALLSMQAKEAIASVLAKHADLVETFGYDVKPPAGKPAGDA